MTNIIVLATTNKNKIKEFKEMLKDYPISLRSLSDFGPLPEIIEDGTTFDENAYKKAHQTAKILGLPTIADDSGLAVEALNGAPGVYSARYAGENSSDQDNIDKLLKEMKGVSNRKATFHCVISIAVPSGPALTYEGTCHGILLEQPRGTSGFGYDPLFYFEELGKTFAECTMEEKNRVSHRGKALKELKSELTQVLKWLKQRIDEVKPAKPDHSEFEYNDWSN